MSTPNVGDKYTRSQVFTVVAVDPTRRTVDLQDDEGNTVTKPAAFLDRLLAIKPPPVVFQVGDTVERLRDGALFTVAVGGYFDHAQGVLVESTAAFTTTNYRKARIS